MPYDRPSLAGARIAATRNRRRRSGCRAARSASDSAGAETAAARSRARENAPAGQSGRQTMTSTDTQQPRPSDAGEPQGPARCPVARRCSARASTTLAAGMFTGLVLALAAHAVLVSTCTRPTVGAGSLSRSVALPSAGRSRSSSTAPPPSVRIRDRSRMAARTSRSAANGAARWNVAASGAPRDSAEGARHQATALL